MCGKQDEENVFKGENGGKQQRRRARKNFKFPVFREDKQVFRCGQL